MVSRVKILIFSPVVLWAFLKFENAWHHVSLLNYAKAATVFTTGEDILRNIGLTDAMNPDHKIIKGYIEFLLERLNKSQAILLNAWVDLDQKNYLNSADREYLKLYISETLRDIIDSGVLEKPIDFVLKNSEDVDLTKVSLNWKEKFPTRGHPQWDLD